MALPSSVSHNLTLASYELMQSGEPAVPSASPRVTSVLHPAPVGICTPQSLLASPEGVTILDGTPCFLGNSQLLLPLPTPEALSALLPGLGGPCGGRGLQGEGCMAKGPPCPCEMAYMIP